MLGFFIGTVCLIGLVKVLRHGHWGHGYHGYHNYRRGWGRGHHGCHGGGFGGGRGRGALKWVFWRLDATHGQEKVILAQWEALSDTLRGLRGEMAQSRAAAAQLLRAEHLDTAALQGVWQQHDALLAKVREALGQSVIHVHAALDDSQRKVLAQWLENGAGRGCC